MKALEVTAEIDSQHRLNGSVPPELRPGRVRVIFWSLKKTKPVKSRNAALRASGPRDLSDVCEDIYTLADAEPEDATG